MCRLAVYKGIPAIISDIIMTPSHSVIDQSKHSTQREDPLNGDGFGIAWYKPELQSTPAIFKDITPAWNHKNLASLTRATKSPLFMAHIRDASPAMPVTFTNTHPFSYEQFSCIHNGHVTDFKKIKRDIMRTLSDEVYEQVWGNTDSEHFFALFLELYKNSSTQDELDKISQCMHDAIAKISELFKKHKLSGEFMFNVVISDGKRIVASRYHSKGVQGLNTLYYTQDSDSVLIASEPLDNNDSWIEVDEDSILTIDTDNTVKNKTLSL
ncbi:class II glutamine amidotransferase [Candidatus Gracilibacteria bacterium]|nr:class II glutamine amidotransferase [Candidatus Gracilibacteria bacterium]